MNRPCETCLHLTIADDGRQTRYCAHPKRKKIELRAEREKGACGPEGINWERNE